MEKVVQYWAFLYWIGNVFAQYIMFNMFAAPYFYAIILIGFIALLGNMSLLSKSGMFRANYFIYVYSICMIVYQFTFGLFEVNDRTWTYLISKVVADMMFVVSVFSYPQFYGRKMFPIMAMGTAVLVFLGVFRGSVDIMSGRQTFGFGNPNALSSITAISAACFYITTEKIKFWHWGILALLIYGALMGGSRSCVAALIIGLLFKYGLKPRTFVVVFLMFAALELVGQMGSELPGISRFIQSVENVDLSSARERERKASILMIKEKPLTGNGLYAQQSKSAKKISELGSHNTYIDLVKFMGFGVGGFVIIALFVQLARFYKLFYRSPLLHVRSHLFCAFIVPVMGMYEAYIWGVNQMITTMMFISFAYLGYLQKNNVRE